MKTRWNVYTIVGQEFVLETERPINSAEALELIKEGHGIELGEEWNQIKYESIDDEPNGIDDL